jgi:predicted O-linked N-acetylglucosamine transferase (SPINDLY family)
MQNSASDDDALDAIADAIGSGRFAGAESAAAARVRDNPADTEAMRLLAIAQWRQGRIDEARTRLTDALAIAPRSIPLLCNLGSLELARGDAAAARDALERAFALAPDDPAVLIGLGNARRAAGDLVGARDAYRAATSADAAHGGAWLNLAAVELALGEPGDAERVLRHVLSLAPGHPEALLLLGHAFGAMRRFAEAEAAYVAGAKSLPDDARFPYHAGLMAEEQKQLSRAAAFHERALALDPSLDHALGQLAFLKRQLCDWHGLDALSARLRAAVARGAPGITPFGFLSEPATPAEQLRCARNAATAIDAAAAPLRARLGFGKRRPRAESPRLRVGFVSNGFGHHPTGLLIVAMFAALCEHVDLVLFATTPDDGSAIRRRLVAAAHEWHDVADLAPLALATRIDECALSIVVDLSDGSHGVAEALALRPAPVRVAWLVYPGTTGAPWIDVAIADHVVLPDALRPHFSEAIAWLPRAYQPNDPTRAIVEPPSRVACGLPATGPVFVSFNNSYKLNARSMTRMFAVLRAVPDATLWLLSGPDGADDRLRAAARDAGIDAKRLVFSPRLPHEEYLGRYRHADLFLDTDPYNAHTTASDALFAGCPVLTAPGATFASRVAASLNAHLGLDDTNVVDDDAFVAFATRVGRDVAFRDALRAKLAERRTTSALFDMQGFARDFADVLLRIDARARAGLAPADFG